MDTEMIAISPQTKNLRGAAKGSSASCIKKVWGISPGRSEELP